MVTMLCISAEFQFDVVNIDGKLIRKARRYRFDKYRMLVPVLSQ